MEEINKKEEELQKELNDTKAYLTIVMQELEEIKAKVDKPKPTHLPEKKEIFKYVAIIETVLLLAVVGIFIIYQTNKDSVPAINADGSNSTQDPSVETVAPIVETKKMNADLVTAVADLKLDQSMFEASVVSMFGYEYLCFSSGTVKVYYRNEFPKTTTKSRCNIMIDNGLKMAEFSWDYDLSKPLENLVPYFGSYLNDDNKQLVFTVFTSDTMNLIPDELRVIQTNDLWEYAYLDINETLKEVFAITYEEHSTDINSPDYRMKLAIGATNYTYAISKDDYVNAMYYEDYLIQHDDYFQLDFKEDSIIIKTVAYLSNQAYLGELSAKVAANQGELSLEKVSYAAYVEPNQEDIEKEGLIIPRTTRLSEERLTLWGKNRETFLLEKSQILERNTLINDNFIKDENGYGYYEDGIKKTVFGIDVSKYQGDIDWETVKAYGVEFAIVRVGFRGNREGTLELDPYFHQNMEGAIKAGIPVGVYFFSQAINETEAIEEASFVLEQIKDYNVTYPVIFDTEQMASAKARANDLSRQLRTDITKAFCETIDAAGYHPMIYANTKQLLMGIDLEQLTEYDLWFAYYGSDLQFPYQFEMYQFSQEGTIPGIKGAVDLNLSFIDYSIE